MSTRAPHELTCRHCGHDHTVMVLKGMHITSLPDERAQLLAGTLHRFACPTCGEHTRVEVSTVYTDFDRSDYVAVEPVGTVLTAQLRARHQQLYDQAFTFGPEVAQELGRGFRTRLVAGMPSLREKVLAWDHGLDDRVIEAVKDQVQRALGVEEEWRLASVIASKHLMFARLEPSAPPPEQGAVPERAVLGFKTVRASVYARALRDRVEVLASLPGLSDPWVVDLQAGRGGAV